MKTFTAKSVIISRKPGKTKDSPWSAFIGMFLENNPHMKGNVPFEVLEIKGLEKVRLRELRNVSLYLSGNDLVINCLKTVSFLKEGGILTVSGEQDLPDDDHGCCCETK